MISNGPASIEYQLSHDPITLALKGMSSIMGLVSLFAVPSGAWLAWHFPFGLETSLHRVASLTTYFALFVFSFWFYYADPFWAFYWYAYAR
ncbi:membrane protein [Rhodopirellula sallentina SM41]|uniref:Membrane protein n=1 Tax=Rhodopirellula sallentina SM41 TaxID=1263870 RepID=M5TY78_9BACT|nr:membrane protein [Rhodopirellula sallentina SM41]